jgi:hypothetical protein
MTGIDDGGVSGSLFIVFLADNLLLALLLLFYNNLGHMQARHSAHRIPAPTSAAFQFFSARSTV